MGFAIATICGHVDGIRFHLYITAGLDPKNLLFGEGGGGRGEGGFHVFLQIYLVVHIFVMMFNLYHISKLLCITSGFG